MRDLLSRVGGNGAGLAALSSVTSIEPMGYVAGSEDFVSWYGRVEPRVRLALMAAYGPQRGREATAEAMAWAWEHQDRIASVGSPVAYLFRVGRSRTRLRRLRVVHGRDEWSEPWVEPALAGALADLSERQRVAVMLVHGYGWTLGEAGEVMGVKATTVQSHVERGLSRLRSVLEVSSDG